MGNYDKNGMEITPHEWALLFEQEEYRRVAWDELPNGCIVSTVWLGIDHGFGRFDRPLIFETMASADGGSTWDGDSQERTSTMAEAEITHKRTVALWLNREGTK